MSSSPLQVASSQRAVMVTLWANGFTVDDSELRDFNDSANRPFLEDLQRRYECLKKFKEIKNPHEFIHTYDRQMLKFV